MTDQTTAWADINFEENGKQAGWVHMPHSTHSNAWGVVRIPIGVIKNGAGPTVLLMGGNHGDEFEGQVIVPKLFRKLTPDNISGRIIFLPSTNYPACLVAERVSPVDGGNLNRSFPGNARGSLTEKIAHYIDTVLYPICDWHIDMHAGGIGEDVVLIVSAFLGNDDGRNKLAMEAVKLFDAPYYLAELVRPNETAYASASAVKNNVISLGGEFGSSADISEEGMKSLEDGIPRILQLAGVLDKEYPVKPLPKTAESRQMKLLPTRNFVYSPCDGLFEPAVNLGESVKAGQFCGLIHATHDISVEPQKMHFAADGVVITRRHIRRVNAGSCLFGLAEFV